MAGRFWELLLILLIVFVMFGAGKLPKVMGDLGRGIKAMRSGLKDEEQKSSENEQNKA